MNLLMQDSVNEFSRYIPVFLIILLRTSIFVSFIPIIGSNNLPMQFRMGLAVFISLLLTPVVDINVAEDSVPLLVVREMLIGMTLGFTVRLVFMAVNMAGSFISHMVGMSIATTFNPEMGQSTQIAEMFGIMAMLFFLAMNVHHEVIYIFVKSFEILPAGGRSIASMIPKVVGMGSKLFIIALKICAPVLVCLLISHILAGFLYKAAPQINIFFVTMPLNIFLGFLLIIMSIPVFENVLGIQFKEVKDELTRLIFLAKG